MSYKYTRGGTYKSRNTEEIDKLRQKYLDRGDFSFSYDPNKDNAYQEYAKMMRTQGSLAMEDAMGKAAASTGGYGNSYAQTIGQQTYQDYAKDISAAQSTFEDRAYDRALNAFTNEGNAILDKMGMLENRESADKAAWEEDYLSDYNNAVASGDTKEVAAVLGMTEDDYKEQLAASKTALGDEQIAGYLNAILNGDTPEGAYFAGLESEGYDVSNIDILANKYAIANNSGFNSFATTDENGNAVNAITYNKADINNNIEGIANTNKGQNFHVRIEGGDDLDVQIGDKIDNSSISQIVKKRGKGLTAYNDKIYYYDGANVYAVEKQGWGKGHEYKELLNLLKGKE